MIKSEDVYKATEYEVARIKRVKFLKLLKRLSLKIDKILMVIRKTILI